MHDFVSHVLRRYFEATAWNEYNSYLHLTSSSAAILDFPIPTGLTLSISASPTPPFFTTYRLGALPNLRAGIGYIYASTHTPIDFGRSSKDVKLKQIIERFRIVEAPRRPAPTSEHDYYWLAGQRYAEPSPQLDAHTAAESGEYLVYGCMHVPSARLDALWTKRISPTWQLILTAVSTPPKYPLNALQNAALATQSAYASAAAASTKASGMTASVDRLDASTHTLSSSNANLAGAAATQQSSASAGSTAAAAASYGVGPPGSTNLQLTLQRDTGRWFTEYSYSVDDALWGFRVLHNFGAPADATAATGVEVGAGVSSGVGDARAGMQTAGGVARIDSASAGVGGQAEGDADAGGGLRGRFSAGAEVFVSTVEKSAGLSTGIRFSTLPDTPPVITPTDAAPSQPPTVITATLNPMMGHLSTAYAARMARDVVVCSRFDFNVYSYESEWTVGAEYWLRATRPSSKASSQAQLAAPPVPAQQRPAPATELSLREPSAILETYPRLLGEASYSLRPEADASPPAVGPPHSAVAAVAAAPAAMAARGGMVSTLLSPITGVLKARISTASDIRLLWQGRLSHCLVSLGVKADLSPSSTLASSTATAGAARMGIVKSVGVEVMYFSQADDE